ncbi:MAG: hypothetical protein IT184_16010 [Acidobacteria bacterium]|nr:hypothetical protein [Acidobacteriota bacterium]
MPATLAIASLILLQPNRFRATAERELSARLGLDVRIESLSLSIVPRWRVSGTSLVVRDPAQPELPPFLAIDHFWMDVGLLSALRRHVDTVHVGGLRINVPPDDSRPDFDLPDDGEAAGDIIVNRLETENGELTILRKQADQPPLVFKIRELEVRDVGFGRKMPFSTSLVNPVPEGRVDTSGTIGPWRKGQPAALPLSGDYTFSLADLDTIKGVGGTLTSEGTYEGHLTAIRVAGWTDTPDFNLDIGGKPVPLKTTFRAVVDGSNGSTELESVDATLFDTPLHVTGRVENLPGPGRHDISLKVTIDNGRIEDLLRLSMDASTPMMTGAMTLESTVALAPGRGPVRDRLALRGAFRLAQAHFTDGQVQAKLVDLSLRSRGKPPKGAAAKPKDARLATNLRGRFQMARGVLTLTSVTFMLPGATVAVRGRYGLASRTMDFDGTLRMQATVSQAVGGVKSWFIKPFDWLFRRDGAGAVVPIRISGTPDDPKLGVRIGKVLTRSD